MLTGKQKRTLRGIGQLLDPVIFVGKEGVSEASVTTTNEALRRRELIKVRVLNTAPDVTDGIAKQLADATGGDVAGRVGHTFLLYRPNPELRERIELPPGKE